LPTLAYVLALKLLTGQPCVLCTSFIDLLLRRAAQRIEEWRPCRVIGGSTVLHVGTSRGYAGVKVAVHEGGGGGAAAAARPTPIMQYCWRVPARGRGECRGCVSHIPCCFRFSQGCHQFCLRLKSPRFKGSLRCRI
jgi:hypothetical protein